MPYKILNGKLNRTRKQVLVTFSCILWRRLASLKHNTDLEKLMDAGVDRQCNVLNDNVISVTGVLLENSRSTKICTV